MFFCSLLTYKMILEYYAKYAIEKSKLAQRRVSSGLGITVRLVCRRGIAYVTGKGKLLFENENDCCSLQLPCALGAADFIPGEGSFLLRKSD